MFIYMTSLDCHDPLGGGYSYLHFIAEEAIGPFGDGEASY